MSSTPRLGKHQLADLGVLLVLSLLVLWYLNDAYTASTDIRNLIMVLPLSVIVLVLCMVQFIQQLRAPIPPAQDLETITSVLPVITLFATYVITLPWLGFDVGTFLFIALFLWFHGERRWQWTLGYSLCFATLTVLFFSKMLPYPMPMLLLASDY